MTDPTRERGKAHADATHGCAGDDGPFWMTDTTLRLCLLVILCAGLNGCLLLDAPQIERTFDVAVHGAERERCIAYQSIGIGVTETVTPADEGEVQSFGPAQWHAEFERGDVHTFGLLVWYTAHRESDSPRGRVGTPADGTLAVTDRAVVLVSPPSTIVVHIPYEVLLKVDISPANRHHVIVNSCFGRYDVFALRQQGQVVRFDPEAAAAAADRITIRAAAFRAAANKAAQSSK